MVGYFSSGEVIHTLQHLQLSSSPRFHLHSSSSTFQQVDGGKSVKTGGDYFLRERCVFTLIQLLPVCQTNQTEVFFASTSVGGDCCCQGCELIPFNDMFVFIQRGLLKSASQSTITFRIDTSQYIYSCRGYCKPTFLTYIDILGAENVSHA